MLRNIFYRVPQLKLYAGIIFGILLLDQITKYLARIYLFPVRQIPVLGDFFRLTYVENTGIAFGIQVENKVFFTALSIIAVLIIFYYLFKLREHWKLRIAFLIILGGACGNLIDRFLYGKVVDFLDFEFFDINLPTFKLWFFNFRGYEMSRWPVFNIADIAVTVGMILIIFSAFFEKEKEGIPQNDIPEHP